MRTTLDLPDELIRTVKTRAIQEDRKLKDMIALLLRRGLAGASEDPVAPRRRVRLPLVDCAHEARPEEEITPERVARALLADERIAMQAREPAGIESRWRELAAWDTASPKLWMDAYLAAFALSAGYRMVTNDSAFRQFGGLDLLVLGCPGRGAGAVVSSGRRSRGAQAAGRAGRAPTSPGGGEASSRWTT